MSFGKMGALGRGFGHLGALGGVGYRFTNTEAATLVAAMSPQPNNSRKAAIDAMVGAFKTAGIWTKTLVMYAPAAHAQQAALLNWKDPTTNNLTAVNSPTFTANIGFKGDDVNSRHLVGPTWAAIKALGYAQNNNGAAYWTLTGNSNGTGGIAGMSTDTSSQPFTIGPNDGAGHITFRNGTTGNDTIANIDGAGMASMFRNASGTYEAYMNKTKSAITQTSASVPSDAAKLTFLRAATGYCNQEFCFGALFTYLTPTEQGAMYDAVSAYLTSTEAVSNSNGVWNWDNDPRGILFNGNVTWSGMTSAGTVTASTINGSSTSAVNLYPALDLDDHCSAAFLIRESDSRLLAFYLNHNDTHFYVQQTTNPLDPSAWDARVDISSQIGAGGITTFSYAAPFFLPAEGKILCWHRGGPPNNWTWCVTTSTDGGTTWSATTLIHPQTVNRPYTKIARSGSARIDVFHNDGHPDAVPTNNTYHYYYQGGAFFKTDGTSLTAPWSTTSSTLVFDGSTANGKSWIYDVTVDPRDNSPVACITAYPSTQDHRFWQLRLVAGVWTQKYIDAAGHSIYDPDLTNEPSYSGGICSDPENPNVVYGCPQINGLHQLCRYVTTDEGATWTRTQIVFSSNKCFRPFVVPGTRTLLYIEAFRYTAYTDYQTRVRSLDIRQFQTEEAETTFYCGAMNVAPSSSRRTLIDNLIKGLKSDGVWPKLDVLYLMASHDAQAARLNLVSRLYDCSLQNSPSFTTDRGYTSDGSTSYLDTGFNPTTGRGIRVATNEVHLGAFPVTNAQGGSACGNAQLSLAPRDGSNNATARVSTGSSATVGSSLTSSVHHYIVGRNNTSTIFRYRDGAPLADVSSATVGLNNSTIWIGGRNGGGSFLAATIGAVHAGRAITAADAAALYSRLSTYLSAVGAI